MTRKKEKELRPISELVLELINEELQEKAKAVFKRLKEKEEEMHRKWREREEDVLLDVQGLADYLSVTTSWVYKNHKTLPYIKLGGLIRFQKSDINKYFQS